MSSTNAAGRREPALDGHQQAEARPCARWSARPAPRPSRRAACGSRGRARARRPSSRSSWAPASSGVSPKKVTNSSAPGLALDRLGHARELALGARELEDRRVDHLDRGRLERERVLGRGDRVVDRLEVPDREHLRLRQLDQPDRRLGDRHQRALRAGHEASRGRTRARGGRAGSRRTGASASGSPRRSRGRGRAGSPAARGRSRPRACRPPRGAPARPRRPARSARSSRRRARPRARGRGRSWCRRRSSGCRRSCCRSCRRAWPGWRSRCRGRSRGRGGATARLRSSWTTPGPTRTRRASRSTSPIASMWREVSSTSPWPGGLAGEARPGAAAHDRDLEARGGGHRGGDVGGVAREGHEQRRVRVQARVAREQVARVGVRAHLAAQLAAQVGGQLRAARLRPAVFFAQEDAHSLPCIGDEPSQRTPLPADPGPDERPGPRPARDRRAHDRPPRAGLRPPRPRGPRGPARRLQDERPGRRLPRLRHRRVGGGARQHAVARRPRARVRDRPLRDAVARDGRAPRARGRAGSRATGATAPTPSALRSCWRRTPPSPP